MTRLTSPLLLLFTMLVSTTASAGGLDISAPHPLEPAQASLADVLAMHAKAVGSPQMAETTSVEEWSYHKAGVAGTRRTVRRGSDFLTTVTFGPISNRYGSIRGIRWRQNENGITAIMAGVHREDEAFKRTIALAEKGQAGEAVTLLGESSSPVPSYVVQVSPPDGRRSWLFYDKTTGFLVRSEEIFPTGRVTKSFGDFREFNGHKLASSATSSDGDPADDETSTLVSYKINVPINEADIEAPGNLRELVAFPDGVSSVPIPGAVHKETGIVIVRVTMNGRGYDLQLDSGADGIFLDDSVVGDLGFQRFGYFGQNGASGKFFEGFAVVPDMRIGDLDLKKVVVVAFPFSYHDREAKVVGLIGYDLLASVGLKIDYDRGTITAYPRGVVPMPTRAFTLPIALDDGVPMVSVKVGEAESDRFVLDTGAFDLTVFPGFAQRHSTDVEDQGLGRQLHERIDISYRNTVVGDIEVVPTQLKRVALGPNNFNEYLGFVIPPDSPFAFEDTDGLLGYHLLRFFNLYFDYFHGQVTLQPNGSFFAEAHHRR